MSMTWVRLDTSFPSNPKVLELVADRKFKAAFAYVTGLAYCGAHGTDGFIPTLALPYLHASKTDAKHLVSVNLWRPVPGGWEVPDWREFQPSAEQNEGRRKRAQTAALKRWNGNSGGTVTSINER